MSQTLTPEALVYDLPQAGEPQVSPDGRQILYTLTTLNRAAPAIESQLWRCDSDGGNARRLTWSGARNSGGRWSPDGRQIAFVSDRVPGSGLFVLPADGGEARELTRHPQTIDQLAWSPDGQRLAYVTQIDPTNPDGTPPAAGAAPVVRVTRRLDYKQDGRGYLNDARRQMFVVDVASGERRQLTDVAQDHAWPAWSPDGRRLAVQRLSRGGLGSQLALIDLDGGATTLVGAESGAVDLWSWSPAGDHLLLALDVDHSSQTNLYRYDIASGALRQLGDDLAILPHAGYPGPVPAQPVWLDERRALLSALRAGRSGLYIVDADTGRLEETHAWAARHLGLSVDRERRLVVQGQTSLTTTGEIAVTDRAAGTTRLITDCSAPLLGGAGIGSERLTVERAGHAIDAWLLLPPGFDPARRYPLLLDIHGGPHNLYGESFLPLAHCLASHGFLVVYANPRGSGSYGRDFVRAVLRDWGGEDYLDLLAVVDTVAARPYVDPARLGIYGFSYGGYMTAWAIGQTDRFAAAVCGAPVFDLESFYGTSDVGPTFGDVEFGVAPHVAPDWYAAHSPSTFAHRARTPTLIIHGEADDRCPIGQGEQMFVALMRAGCATEFARYPGGAHGFPGGGPPEHRVDYLTRSLAWFQKYLTPDA
ncbi:MAG: S9 family peptidase [Chloroflexi bacterium]|nr:S9 family peptidase [Chloroflexota bacterium]